MKMLHLVHVWLASGFYRWAMSEIHPLHPDLPRIVLRQSELRDKMGRLLP